MGQGDCTAFWLGTESQSVYITGGVALVAAMALKQLGQVRGARKRLGQ
ncbi:MAG: hypothetical protein KME16_27240 [Scytolyngbya sp. HA4215-MV1]|nr:hypothetical protein [Scytolyngbya sp. HA4215-MV1]